MLLLPSCGVNDGDLGHVLVAHVTQVLHTAGMPRKNKRKKEQQLWNSSLKYHKTFGPFHSKFWLNLEFNQILEISFLKMLKFK